MTSLAIRFGTSGWRGVIANDFTFSGMRRVAAIAGNVRAQKKSPRRVSRSDRTDGLKLIFDDGFWLLKRPSGTELVVRIYTEAASPSPSQKLAHDAGAWVSE